MPKPKAIYKCPRCGYTTNQKNMMRRHLYLLKKPCAGSVNVVTLTDEIKEHILENREWHPPPQEQQQNLAAPTIQQTINNYNTMNTLVTRVDDLTKLIAYAQYNNTTIVNFSDEVEETYEKRRICMDGLKSKNIFLDQSVFYDAIDDVTSIKDLAQLNILYEDVAQKLRIYDDNEWRTVLFDKGITEIIERIKEHYLDVYERYLIRLYYDDSTSAAKKAYIREHVQEYYKFIACYDLMPFVYDKTDHEICFNEQNDSENERWTMNEYWYPMFKDVKTKLQVTYVKGIKKDVANIVKRNAKANVVELNRKVIELIQMDEDFKKDVLANVIDI